MLYEAGSPGCNSRTGARHLTETECRAIFVSDEFDKISGLASTAGPGTWNTSTNDNYGFYFNVGGNTWHPPACFLTEIFGSLDDFHWVHHRGTVTAEKLDVTYNNIDPTTQNVHWENSQTHRLQICYSEELVPLSEMLRQPVADASTTFVLADATMECPEGAEIINNLDDCFGRAAEFFTRTQQITTDLGLFGVSLKTLPDGCSYASDPETGQPRLFFNAFYHISGRFFETPQSEIPDSNREDFRVVCREAVVPTIAPTTAAPSLTPTAAPSQRHRSAASVPSSHYYVEFPHDPAVSFAIGSVGCNSRAGLRHLTEPECATLVTSGELDAISGLARADGTGPWTTATASVVYFARIRRL